MSERFKRIKGFDMYLISNHGRIYSFYANKFVSPGDNGCGYLVAHLYADSIRTAITVHRLVASHFCRNPENKKQVNHVDFNRKNNHFSNLEWCTSKENVRHSYRNRQKSVVASYGISYGITCPKGHYIVVDNLNDFCRQHNLDQAAMWRTVNGKQTNHKGFTGRYL